VSLHKNSQNETEKIVLHQGKQNESFSVIDEIVDRYNKGKESINKMRKESKQP
jgi:hypothetical protein